MNRGMLGLLGGVLLIVGCSSKAEESSPASGGTAGQPGAGGAGNAAGAGGKMGSAGSAGSPACVEGQRMGNGCDSCQCLQGQWACTSNFCGIFCGGETGNTCGSAQYCAYTPGQLCGAADETATCMQRPNSCDDTYLPVCGCDHMTYPSSCDAAMHGQGVYANGACADPDDGNNGGAGGDDAGGSGGEGGAACGAMAGDTCGAGEFCAYAPGSLCGAADATAQCEPKPTACPTISAPVCGCDRKTYASSCDANLHGQGVYSNGACDSSTAN